MHKLELIWLNQLHDIKTACTHTRPRLSNMVGGGGRGRAPFGARNQDMRGVQGCGRGLGRGRARARARERARPRGRARVRGGVRARVPRTELRDTRARIKKSPETHNEY